MSHASSLPANVTHPLDDQNAFRILEFWEADLAAIKRFIAVAVDHLATCNLSEVAEAAQLTTPGEMKAFENMLDAKAKEIESMPESHLLLGLSWIVNAKRRIASNHTALSPIRLHCQQAAECLLRVCPDLRSRFEAALNRT